jgi:DNA-binding transcriptional LysR family regulator
MFSQVQLRYFVTVSEEGQITRAARRLHIAQPALSQALAQLEAELDIVLFVRHPRGVTLTPAGEAFLVKARAALAAEAETAQLALSLRRAANGAISVGFVGPPPAIGTPELFAAFAESNPDAHIDFQDLPFPCGATSSWLANVDIAVCHPPCVEEGVGAQPVRVEPRALVVHRDHPLAQRSQLDVAEVLEETFVGYHPDVQPEWAGFHSLDDHRGGPPERLTDDQALTSLQMLGIMSARDAVTIVPYADAKLAVQVLPDIVAIPLRDAAPAVVSLIWRTDTGNQLVEDLVSVAKSLAPGDGDLVGDEL